MKATVGMPMEGGCHMCVPQVCAPTSYITQGHGYSPRSQSRLSIAPLGVGASVPWVPLPQGLGEALQPESLAAYLLRSWTKCFSALSLSLLICQLGTVPAKADWPEREVRWCGHTAPWPGSCHGWEFPSQERPGKQPPFVSHPEGRSCGSRDPWCCPGAGHQPSHLPVPSPKSRAAGSMGLCWGGSFRQGVRSSAAVMSAREGLGSPLGTPRSDSFFLFTYF